MQANLLPSLTLKPTTFLFNRPFTSLSFPLSTRRRFNPNHLLALGAADDITGDAADTNPVDPTPEKDYTVEIRFRRGRRKKERQQKQEQLRQPKPPKEWSSMTLAEKATELYMGEKGLLFWLNKFAYASIFIIVGGWILFRFVGPSLGLYQLDVPPTAPK